jgi:UDP-N-acetylmuramate dehydrogenase
VPANLPDTSVKIAAGVDLASRSTLGVGGAAAHFARVTSEAELGAALAWASERAIDVRVLGGGSNIVVSDSGFDGLVIEMAMRGVASTDAGTAVEVRAAAGEPWDGFVQAMVSRGYQGLECLSGIPDSERGGLRPRGERDHHARRGARANTRRASALQRRRVPVFVSR